MPDPELANRSLNRRRPAAISRVPYLPGLDGMRALAVIAVMVYHTSNGWLPGGFIGVEVFFVISGYLITLLLIGEHESTGRISLRRFWLRRARRLLPAVFFMLLLLTSYTAIFKRGELGRLRGDVLAGLGYVSNWYQIWTGQGYTAAMEWAPLRHLWSLAVEEQFYLVWPLVMAGLLRLGRRRLPDISRWVLLAALLIAVAVGVLFYGGREISPAATPEAYWHVGGRDLSKTDTLYLSTITRSTGLLIGAAFAMLWRPVAVMRGPLRRKGWLLDLLALIGLASLALLAWGLHFVTANGPDPLLFRGGFIAVGLATVLVMAAVTHSRALAGPILGNPVLRWAGTRSYGLYLFHWPIYQIIRKVAANRLTVTEFVVAMAVTVVITELSYRIVETPIRRRHLGRWMQRLRQNRDPIPRRIIGVSAAACVALAGFAGASMATAELKPSEFEQNQEAGAQFTTPLLADSVPATSPATSEAPGPATTEATPESTTPATDPPPETFEMAAVVTDAPTTTRPTTTTTRPTTTTTRPPTTTTRPPTTTTRPPTSTTRPANATATASRPTTTTTRPTTTTIRPTTTTIRPTTTTIRPTTTTIRPTTTTTVPPTTVPVTVPPTTPAPTPAPTTRPPVVQAIGDSVMLGAAENLAARGVIVDAAQSRQMRDYLPNVQALAAQGGFGDVVVVHLGTNGSFSEATMTAFFDALASVPRVIVLNVHADRGWTQHNNELLATLPGRYANVMLLDWNTVVNQCEGNCLYDDGIHLPPAGRRFYADLIFRTIGI